VQEAGYYAARRSFAIDVGDRAKNSKVMDARKDGQTLVKDDLKTRFSLRRVTGAGPSPPIRAAALRMLRDQGGMHMGGEWKDFARANRIATGASSMTAKVLLTGCQSDSHRR
jgi:hypothetical protein